MTGVLAPVAAVIGALCLTLAAAVLVARVIAALVHLRRLEVAGRWVVITGCDSGIGRLLLDALVKRGAKVMACCLTKEGADTALGAGAAEALVFDLIDEAATAAAARQIDARCDGALWALVHNAGIVLPGFVDYQPLAFFRRVMEVNFFGPVHLTRQLLEPLRRARGRVIVVSSVDGIVSLPGNAPYDASKFAVEAWADALRAELSFWGVGVSVVNPATMRTPLAMGFFELHRRAWEETARVDPIGAWTRAYPRSWLDEYVRLNTANLARIAQDPRHAVDDLVHAVCAARPKLRYLSGTLAKTLFYALWVMPESWALRFKRTTIRPPPSVTGATKDGA
jgi:NAD(P)-dependent dehydrogenase (short-subunit alcohol dehydrogenase family)